MDLVIQGPYTDYTDKIIYSYLNLPFVRNIIVSCWESDKKTNISDSRVKFVRSPAYEGWPGSANVNLQLTTCLAGVQSSDAPWVGKMRSDQLFNEDGLINMYEFFVEHRGMNKIFVTGNVFDQLFHPKDWVYWGSNDDLINLFDIPHEINDQAVAMNVDSSNYSQFLDIIVRPETYIGMYYCNKFDDRVQKMLDYPTKYLYDGGTNWKEAYTVSSEITPKVFKCFSRKGIHFTWPRKGINVLPFDSRNEGWNEEGY